MNTLSRRVLLALTAALGLYVGIWAEFFSRSFYYSFPGFGRHWISTTGAWDEHLISDVGSFYLAMGAVSIAAIMARTAGPGRLAGLGWTVFGVLHFGYHVTHLTGSAADKAGVVVSLGISAVVGIVLLLPPRYPRRSRSARSAAWLCSRSLVAVSSVTGPATASSRRCASASARSGSRSSSP